MRTCLPHGMLATTCALAGIGKEPTGASTRTVLAVLAGGEVGCNAASEDGGRLAPGDDAPGLAVVTPALHAARDSPAAQVVRAMATGRYRVTCHLLSVMVVAAQSLEGRRAAQIAVMSRIW